MKVDDVLQHYGILGMRWGQHKTITNLDYKGLKNAKTANLKKWGKDPQHNILYITGYSGSGKSTIARQLADSKTNVIHLDPYFEKMDKNVKASIQDKEFNLFLQKHFPEYETIANPSKEERHSKEWWAKVDNLMFQTETFATNQFSKNKKVIVEGVQLQDSTTYPNKNFFKDKPIIIMGTNPLTSFFRASKRDGRSTMASIQSAKEYTQWYFNTYKNLNVLSEHVNTKAGEEWINNYLSIH